MSRSKTLTAALALLPAAAFAQQPEIVVTATGVPQSIAEVGQAITVIDRATIETRQTTVLSDLLATTPGVTVSRTGGIGSVTSVRIRGAASAQTLVLIDGVRVNDPSEPAGAFDFGPVLAGFVDRIEILRGPNAVAWGSQALGGIVAITSRPPADTPALDLSAEYGDYETARATASASYGVGPISARFGGSYARTDGVSARSAGTEADGFEQYGANGRVGVALGDAVALDLRGYYTRSKNAFDSPFSAGDTNDEAVARQLIGYAGLTANLFDGALANRIGVSHARIDRAYTGGFDFEAHGTSNRAEYRGDARFGEAVRGVFGVEYEATRLRTFDAFSGTDIRTTGIWSAYGQLLVRPLAGLNLTGGVRHDEHRTFGGKTTVGANAVFTVANTTLRASYGEGFKAPSLSQLFGFGGSTDLRPEETRSIDIGIEQRLIDNRLRASITWFDRRSRNLIVSNPATFQLSNIARAEADGIEFELAARPVPALTLTANYSYVRSIDATPGGANEGRDLQLVPRQHMSASVDWVRDRFTLGATILVVGDSFDNRANTVRIDGYATADIRASVALGEQFSLFGRVENLFDAQYETVSGFGTLGRNGHVGIRLAL
ncbi:MAG: TonB-dependent receptor plug domain-containing protein [Sphingomonadaceae bacterium]